MAADGRFGRNAVLLWGAQFVSASGDALFMPCLAWLAARTGGGRAAVGDAVFFAYLPYLLLAPLAGAWVDRADKRLTMIVSDLLRAALLLALPAYAAWWGGVTYGLVVAVGILLASFSTPFLPARDALLPTLVGRRSLARWNAVMQTSHQLAMIVGLAFGGLLMSSVADEASETERVVRVMQIDGATFLLSALLLAFMTLPKGVVPDRPRTHLLRDALDGLVHAGRDRVVLGLLILTAINNLAIMGPAIVGAALLMREIGLGPSHYAWFEACMAVGMVVGSLIIATRGRAWPMRKVLLWGLVWDGITYLPFLILPDYPSMLAMITLHGVFIPFIIVGRTSLVQQLVPAARHGKVFALVGLTVVGMTAVSAWVSGVIAEAWGPRALFGVAGVFGAGSGIVAFFAWRFDERARAEAASPDVA